VSGALDWYSHRLANCLLGNDPDAATLEVTLLGPHIRFEATSTFAVTGAEFGLTVDDEPVDMNRPLEARPGSTLKFGGRLRGARAYVAVSGGIDVPPILGSRSTHVLAGMGGLDGRALKKGDALMIGATVKRQGAIARPSLPFALFGAKLRAVPADERLFANLIMQRFLVSPRSDRMGYRLDGPSIVDTPTGELISTAVPTGAIQVPPTGKPILLMNDHATTGGYAIAATVITADLPLAGQLAPGDWVEFEACSIDAATAELRRQEATLDAR
jgi:antagonist of KipI